MAVLTLTITNDSPTGAGTVLTPTGGAWASKTISLRVVAWYRSSESNIDDAGINRGTVAAWNNITVGASDSIQLAFTHAARAPHHYSFYYQEAATWDSANAAKKCTAVITPASPTQSLCEVANDDDTATVTFGAAPSGISLSPITGFEPMSRTNTLRAYNNSLVKKDYVDERLLDAIVIAYPVTALGAAQDAIIRLTRWQKYSNRLTLSTDLTGNLQFLGDCVGKVEGHDYLHATGLTTDYEASFTFLMETEVEEN